MAEPLATSALPGLRRCRDCKDVFTSTQIRDGFCDGCRWQPRNTKPNPAEAELAALPERINGFGTQGRRLWSVARLLDGCWRVFWYGDHSDLGSATYAELQEALDAAMKAER